MSLQERAAVHAALADPIRLALFEAVAISDRTPGDLASDLWIGSNLLAHHLGVLERAGLVHRQRSDADRRNVYVRATPEVLAEMVTGATLQAEGIVFVCTHNSARSQLAEAMWNRQRVGIRARSAGTHPAARVHPGAIRAARRRDIDLGRARPRGMTGLDLHSGLVVTVCDKAREELGDRGNIHWSIPDPVREGTPEAFERAASEIEGRVDRLARSVAMERGSQRRRGGS
jgi:ArsR family transcriptional regulator, arsenate/arsenite/antimonite-responsive transcriptional repressor / arsenate reductase (thioredoxin)